MDSRTTCVSSRNCISSNGTRMCPCCNLLKTTYDFIDPIYFNNNAICNECRARNENKMVILNLSQESATYPSRTTISSKQRKIVRDRYKDYVYQLAMKTVPHSTWYTVSPQKSQRINYIYEAKLIHHRLYNNSKPVSFHAL